ncbi:MAG: hypothetical protein VBE63_25290 [Lamprobacter sp.]|uniref:hypothetical protein n=1 Tax=Lamprobacter sp. TaxID=3100796 RepID=UPI002B25E6A8|nr:hypothetical protein [Lamprobacter sp.]MEA3643225.1 hypothetical protein [Lamprobacter sp.]
MTYQRFSVSRSQKAPLLAFILSALDAAGCRVIHCSDPSEAPFRISFEAPDGERLGIIAYAFLANSRRTRNRPADEHRFQVKYGPKTGELHELWQDPFGLYTTLFLGINPERGFFVAADPVLHSPTRFFISVEFKEQQVQAILDRGWLSWERQKRSKDGLEEPAEVMVGGLPDQFLRYVRFERAAKGLDTGHRGLLADKVAELERFSIPMQETDAGASVGSAGLHQLATEFQLTEAEILDLIESAPRLKMAVRGWVAETHLLRQLAGLPVITECTAIEEDGRPDLRVSLRGGRPLLIECKNILRRPYADGSYRLDFQRTRAAKGNPCSRYYTTAEFDVVAACLHPQTERWDFRYALTRDLDPHEHCPGRLSNRARIDSRWGQDVVSVLERALI